MTLLPGDKQDPLTCVASPQVTMSVANITRYDDYEITEWNLPTQTIKTEPVEEFMPDDINASPPSVIGVKEEPQTVRQPEVAVIDIDDGDQEEGADHADGSYIEAGSVKRRRLSDRFKRLMESRVEGTSWLFQTLELQHRLGDTQRRLRDALEEIEGLRRENARLLLARQGGTSSNCHFYVCSLYSLLL